MANLVTLLLLSVGVTAVAAGGAYGLDTIGGISSSTFSCMKNSGYSFYIGRVGQSNGGIDQGGISNMRNAWSGGFSYVDAYIFPCVTCSTSAAAQTQNTINALRNAGVKFGTLWLDVERYNWPANQASNRQYIINMANAANNMGVTVGIYTNYYNWQEIVGLDFTNFKNYPLWYAHYDGAANFNDFTPFGGWTKPSIKQYKGDVPGECSVGNIDVNWYPT